MNDESNLIILLLQGHMHLAHVIGDGLIMDNKGKLHIGPECWVESIFGNNIPVGSANAWDKVRHQPDIIM